MRTTLAGSVALVLLLAGATPAAAQLTSLETEDLRLVSFGGAESYLVPYATQTFLNAMRFHRRLFEYRPSEKTTVLLADFSDAGNAGATSVPRDSVVVQIAPLSFAFETLTANERMNTIMNHELVHVVSMDQAAASDRAFRHLFAGKVMPVSEQPESILYFYLTTPRVASPRWFLEGSAVFVDTWMSGGIGRAQGAYDEMVFRAMVKDESRFYDPLGLASEGTKIDFQLQVNSYLYGARFITWLGLQHSPEKVVQWIGRKDGSRAYYASQFRMVFGQGLQEAWRDWIAWERTFQQANLEAIRRYPTTPYEDLSKRALGSVSRAFVDPGRKKIYAAFNYPGVVAHVGAISLEDGAVERLVDIKGPSIYTVTSIAYDPEAGTVFYTTDNGAYRDLLALDPRTRKTHTLLKDARIGDLAFDRADRSLWGIRHFNGVCTLVRIKAPYKEWNKVYSWPFGQVAYDLDVSPDGTQVSVSLGEVTGRHGLRVIPVAGLLAGDPKPLAQFDFGTAIPSNFTFSPDGLLLYGSSYYTGVSNVFRYEIATGKLEAMSNTETGFFRPVPLGSDELVVFRFTGQGFVPARIQAKPLEDVSPITFLGERLAETHAVVKSWMLGSPAAISLDTLPQKTRPYHLARRLSLESFYPVAQGYKDFGAVGLRANFSDPLQLNRAVLTASYTPDGDLPSNERLHFRAEYHRYDWSARFKWNDADFYDLVGPTKTGRKGYEAGLGWQKTLVYDEPRRLELTLDGSFSGNLDRLPDFQNVAVDVNELFTLYARLDYTDVRGSLGHVDDEKGKKASLVFRGDYVDGIAVPKVHGTFDLGLPLPIPHSSLWLRNAAGYSTRAREEPFANFFFGGFGNNWVDRGEEKRYREYYSLPGAELNEIGGRNFVKSTAEWNLPPVRFRRVGNPGLYLTWARPALFATVLATDLDAGAARRVVSSLGGQLDFRFTLLSALDMTVSVGYAVALEDGFRPRHEGMVSLKVLKWGVAHIALALLPVVAFLATLVLLDSFKLVRLGAVLQAIAAGALAALAAGPLHGWLLDATGLPLASFSRYVAPLSEEMLKAVYVVFLVQRRRVGFLVDAAIHGFAIGAGFALVENVEYLRALAGASSLLWFVRGLGTALLHGATTSILAMLAKSLGDRYPNRRALAFLPGAAAAVGIHSLFNHALVSPVLASLLLLVAIPAAVLVIFERSEAATREWLGAGLDLDLDLLKLILSGVFPHTRLGAYLESLKARFPGAVVADMFCLLRVELELSIRAKGMLMAREAGFFVPVGADLRANLAELRYLEKSIGRTGLLALKPLHVTTSRDLWHHYLLEQAGGTTRPGSSGLSDP